MAKHEKLNDFIEAIEEEFDLEDTEHTKRSFFFTVKNENLEDKKERVKSILSNVNSSKKYDGKIFSSKDIELVQCMEGEKEIFFTVYLGQKVVKGRKSGGIDIEAIPPKMPKK